MVVTSVWRGIFVEEYWGKESMNKQNNQRKNHKSVLRRILPVVQTAHANNHSHQSIAGNDNHDYDFNMEVNS